MILEQKRMSGHPAPRRHVGRRAGIARDQLEELARAQTPHPLAQLEHKLATSQIARVPLLIGLTDGFVHGRAEVVNDCETLSRRI
jgi:hypothetical protein